MNAIKHIATNAANTSASGVLLLLAGALLAGCSALPEAPTRAQLYDFGPAAPSANAPATPERPALALAEIEAPGLPEGRDALLYRLDYENRQQLHSYGQARWSQPPAQLLQQLLRAQLGQRRAILKADDGSAQALGAGATPAPVLRVEIEEFSQIFPSPTHSLGLLRLRATLLQPSAQGQLLRGQRLFGVQQAAHSADAAGGAAALAQAAAQVCAELEQWLEQLGF